MKWLDRLLGREKPERVDQDIAVLQERSDVTLKRVDRIIAERNRLRDAVRNTATALRAERPK